MNAVTESGKSPASLNPSIVLRSDSALVKKAEEDKQAEAPVSQTDPETRKRMEEVAKEHKRLKEMEKAMRESGSGLGDRVRDYLKEIRDGTSVKKNIEEVGDGYES